MSTARSWEPHDYQKKAMRFLLERGAGGLFLDPGLGKTSITLGTLKTLRRIKAVTAAALVIAPLRAVYEVWDDRNPDSEPRKWKDFHGLRTAVLHGDDRLAALKRLIDGEAEIGLVNPEGTEWLFAALDELRAWPFDVLVIDESTLYKHTQTVRFKILRPRLSRFRRRYLLTGTPAPNGLIDLFGQVYTLDLGNALGRFITQYRLEFFSPSGYGGYTWLPQDGAEERIYERLAPLVLRMSEADYLDLPKLIVSDVPVTLPPKARRIYDDLESHLIADVLGNAVTAANAAVASMKCRQVANGGLYKDGEKGAWTWLHDAKTDALEERIEERGGKPVLIAVDFHHDAERVRKRFGRSIPYLGGGVGVDDARRAIAAWNAGDLDKLLANPATASRALNMQGVPGSWIALHSLTWNYEHYDQLIRRVWRQGRRGRVFVDRLIAKATVDEAMVVALGRKARTQGALFAALRAYAYRRPGRGRRDAFGPVAGAVGTGRDGARRT